MEIIIKVKDILSVELVLLLLQVLLRIRCKKIVFRDTKFLADYLRFTDEKQKDIRPVAHISDIQAEEEYTLSNIRKDLNRTLLMTAVIVVLGDLNLAPKLLVVTLTTLYTAITIEILYRPFRLIKNLRKLKKHGIKINW